MVVVNGLENVKAALENRPVAVALGMFDGVHWGHRSIFQRLVAVAAEENLTPAALTFDKHPTEVLAPSRTPYYINTLEQREEFIAAARVPYIVLANFTLELASLSPDDFFKDILINTLNAKAIVVGSNFRFGKGRTGDTRYMETLTKKLGMRLSVVPAVIINDGPVSSTRIRALISGGDIDAAANLLGRKFVLRGEVVMGRQVGRQLGFPTANIQTAKRQLIPARGVYVVETNIDDISYRGVCNVGVKPTFGEHAETVEVHLNGYTGDLYGRTLNISFQSRLRDEMSFTTPEKLIEQIIEDVKRAETPL